MPLNLAQYQNVDIAFIAKVLNERIHDLALHLLGQPNKALSTPAQLRYGHKGSLAVDIAGDKTGQWFDHEEGIGGDALKLVCHKMNLKNGDACEWAKQWFGLYPKTAIKGAAKTPDILKTCIPVAGTPAETYLRKRGIIKAVPDCLSYRPNAFGKYGALVAKSTDERGNVLAVQQIYITDNGEKAPVSVGKRTNKAVEKWAEKSAVRLVGSLPVVLAEGVETALSIWQETGRETWACLGLHNIGNAPLPPDAGVTVARDGDIKGSKADIRIQKEMEKLARRGFTVSVATPQQNMDFNSLLCKGSREEVRALIETAELFKTPFGFRDQAHALFIGSDVEISARVRDDLIARHGKIIHAEGQFWRYGAAHWDMIPDHELRLATHMYDGAEYQTPKGEPSRVKLGKARVDSILNELAVLVTEEEFFTNAPVGINCASGFIRFSGDGVPTLEPHDRDHRCRHTLPGRWSPDQEKHRPDDPLLNQLLKGAFHDDEDAPQKKLLLAEVCGAAALGYATKLLQPRAVILKGEKAENGKSQILDLARGLLPLSAISSVTAARMGDERHVIGLIGKLLNASDELSSSSAIASETFKAIITGEPVDGRDVYKSRIEFRPLAQHIFATNTLPPFQGGMDRGVQRRLLVITFNRIIPLEERIESIGRRIAAEESDLLLEWAVEGASRLIRQRNFTIPPSSKIALTDWILGADPVLAWLDACVTIKPHSGNYPCLTTREAYDSFRSWAVAEGFKNDKLPAINGFVQRVQANAPGLEHKRTKDGRYFLGMIITRTAHSLSSAPYTSSRW